MATQKLTPFLKEVLERRWSEFATMERDLTKYTSNQAVVFSLVRACAKGKMPAIKEALDRIDGRVAMEIEVEYPKFFFLYPLAKTVALPEAPTHDVAIESGVVEALPEPEPEPDEGLPASLRITLDRMAGEPRALVKIILEAAIAIDASIINGDKFDAANDPLVKSVVIAGLLNMAHKGDLKAIFEVLDQIDGKVADKIKVLGEDVYINVYSEVAPAGAEKNANGVYQLTANNTTDKWAASLERQRNKGTNYDRRV